MKTARNHSLMPLESGQGKGRFFVLNCIIEQVEKGTGKTLSELKKMYSEDYLFQIGLQYVTTTKKAYCVAMKIPVEAGCRYKRSLEKKGLLAQSSDKFFCPYTNHLAHLISTNRDEFARLLKSKTTQLQLF